MSRFAVLLILALCLASVSAFFGVAPISRPQLSLRSTAQKMSMGTDLRTAEEEALAATKKFGIKSQEAVSAWAVYEEIASSDNSAASKPSLDQACEVDDGEKCAVFEAQMKELNEILKSGVSSVTTEALAAQNKKLMEENSRLRKGMSAYK